ncbi:MAG: hypothetical protein ABIP74_05380 [Candidatus Saccharimonas sp.]
MSTDELTLTEASYQKIRGFVGDNLSACGLIDKLDPSCADGSDALPEFIEMILSYLLTGQPSNGAEVYFDRPDGLTEQEYLSILLTVYCAEVTFEQDFKLELSDLVRSALGRITLDVKLAADEDLAHMPMVVLRIRLVEDLLRERRR